MLTATKLEKIIELEDSLRSQYQAQLDEKSAEIERHIKETEAQKVIVEKQLEQLTKLSTASSSGKRLEQLNRELENRSQKLEEELATQKKRLKGLQKDLGEERAQVKALKQFDVAAMRKNLDASKKKLAEKTKANELLQKSVNKTKAENAEFQNKIKELEAKLAELEPADEEGAEKGAEKAKELFSKYKFQSWPDIGSDIYKNVFTAMEDHRIGRNMSLRNAMTTKSEFQKNFTPEELKQLTHALEDPSIRLPLELNSTKLKVQELFRVIAEDMKELRDRIGSLESKMTKLTKKE